MTSQEVSEMENEVVEVEQGAGQGPFTRGFPVDLEAGDGRTIVGCCVPYGRAAEVCDDGRTVYSEMFMPGCVTNAPGRMDVYLNFEHERGLGGIVGRAVELDDRQDGLYGTFRALDHSDAEKALELVREKVLTGMSVEFRSKKHQIVSGVVQRLRVHIDRVSLCRWPAYEAAQVLAVREEPIIEVPLEPVAMPDELAEKLARVGVELLRRVTVTRAQWDDSKDRFTDEEYQRACLVDREGDAAAKERCLLPVLEPNGDLNANAVTAAASTLVVGRGLDPAQRASAARKLIRYYRLADLEPTEGLRRLAST